MSKYLKQKELAFFSILSAVLFALGIFCKLDHFLTNDVITIPLTFIGNCLRETGKFSDALAFIFYALLCLLPLIFPVIRARHIGKFARRDLAWAGLSFWEFILLYFAVNPHRMPQQKVSGFWSLSVILAGLLIIFIAILAVCLILEFYAAQKKDENKIFVFAKLLLMLFITAILADVLFLRVAALRIEFLQAKTVMDGTFDIAAVILFYLIRLVPDALFVLLCLKGKEFLESLQGDMFSPTNVPKLQSIIETCALTIFSILGAAILINILNFIFAPLLTNIYYSLTIPFGMILAACLISVFAKMLIKSIEINEENKLVV